MISPHEENPSDAREEADGKDDLDFRVREHREDGCRTRGLRKRRDWPSIARKLTDFMRSLGRTSAIHLSAGGT
jgi:hypothetical protein